MDYKRIIEKLENHEKLTKDEELAAQLALVHLPIPYRTRANVIKHLKKLFKHELKKSDSLDSDSCMMGGKMLESIQKAKVAIKTAQTAMSLGAIERKLQMMEDQGLEDTQEYKELSARADELADHQSAAQENQKRRELEDQARNEELAHKERVLGRTNKINQAWEELEQQEWFKKVRKHYPIEQLNSDTWRVTSLANDWSEDKNWEFASEVEAKEKVLGLIKQRYADHYLREDRPLAKRPPREIEDTVEEVLEKAKASLNALQRKIFAGDEPDKPKKVTEIADAIRRDNPDVDDSQAYRMAWETYCSYTNPSYEGCTSKGKSKRKSPKSEY